MKRFIVCVAVSLLVSCASMGNWRELQIDATSPEAFDDSVNLFMDGLPYMRRELFSLALTDIWYTGLKDAAVNEGSFTEAEFMAQLDGLGYEEIIAIADAEEPRVSNVYAMLNRNNGPAGRRPASAYGGQGFPGVAVWQPNASGSLPPAGWGAN